MHIKYGDFLENFSMGYRSILLFHDIGKKWASNYDSITLNEFKTFVQQLRKWTDIITLNQFLNGQNGVVLTFDDGKQGIRLALDWLEEQRIPSTVYVSSYFITENYFWRDAVNEIERNSHLFDFNDKYQYRFKDLYKESKSYQDQIRIWNDIREFTEIYGLNSRLGVPVSMKDLNNYRFVTIGNHTHRHLNCGMLSKQDLKDEIALSREFIEQNFLRIDKYCLSLPFGSHDMVTSDLIDIAKEQGYFNILLTSKRSCHKEFNFEGIGFIERILPLDRQFLQVLLSDFKNRWF